MTRKQLIKEIKKTMNSFEWAANEYLLKTFLSDDELKLVLKNRLNKLQGAKK